MTDVDDPATDFEDDLDDVEVSESASEPSRPLRVAATAMVIVPIVTAVIRAIVNDWFPIGDNALLFIRTRDVLTEDHPYLGSWTSSSLSVGENMNNPGAMYDWLVAPFAHLLPPGPAAAIGVGAVNIAMVCLISASAHRIGGWAFQRWALLFTAILAWAMGSEMLFDIWQANALILPFVALLILAIGVGTGDDAVLPWAAVVTSLLLQTHISYAYVFVFIVLAVGGIRIAQRHRIDSSGWRRPVVASVAVVAVLWSLSFWEQFFGPGKGNMSRLLGNASGGDVSLGLADAARIVADLGARPPFWGRSSYATTVRGTRLTEGADGATLELTGLMPTWLAAIAIAALATALVALTVGAHRRGRRTEATAGVLATVLLLGSVVALSRLTVGTVGFSPHHVRWAWPMMAFVHLCLVVLVAGRWTRSRSTDRLLTSAITIVVVVTSLWNVRFLAQPSGPTTDIATMATMRRIEPRLDVLDAHQPVLYDVENVRVFEPFSSTMMMWLQEDDIEFRVTDEAMIRQLGEARRADGDEPTTIFQLQSIDALTYAGEACMFAAASDLDAQDEQSVRAMVDAAAAELATSIGTSPVEARNAILRREFEVFEPEQQRRVDAWVVSAYALLATGSLCDDPAVSTG